MKNSTLKSTLKLIGIMIGGAILGFFMSTGAQFISRNIGGALPLSSMHTAFQWVLLAVTIIQILLTIYHASIRQKIKKDHYQDEENSVYTRYEDRINLWQGIGTGLAVCIIPIYFGFVFYGKAHILWMLACFILIVVLNLLNEIAVIRLNGKMNPKMPTDFSSFKLSQKLYDQMDECEKEKMGRVGAQLVNRIHIIFAIVMLILLACAGVLAFSGYEMLVTGVLWGTFTWIITWETHKVSK